MRNGGLVLVILGVGHLLFAAPANTSFSKSTVVGQRKIQFYPAVRDKDRILIPFTKAPPTDAQVIVLHKFSDKFLLKPAAAKAKVKPKKLVNPSEHTPYVLSEGKWGDERTNVLVAVGKDVKSALQWKSRGTMREGAFPDECMGPSPEMEITHLDVVHNPDLKLKFFQLTEQIYQTTYDKMSEQQKNSAAWYKQSVGVSDSDANCQILAWNSSDGDGMGNAGSPEPVGSVYGVVEVTTGKTNEKWLVLDAKGYEIWGYTFIELGKKTGKGEPRRVFLEQGGS